MKLVINIPCLNEEENLDSVVSDIPKKMPGINMIELQVVDDGSSDETTEVARKLGCRVIRHNKTQGLGRAFYSGVQAALAAGADIMVNTDGDHQYPGLYIPDLIAPILAGEADIVIGNRQPWGIKHFSLPKRTLHWLGRRTVRRIVGEDIPDTVSGFRAYSSEALLRLTAVARFSYTLDTILQASRKGLHIVSIPIETNEPTRPPRLYRNIFQYVFKSAVNITSVFVVYEPFRAFSYVALLFLVPAALLAARFLYFYLQFQGEGHIQSLIASAIGFTLAGIMFSLGVIGGLINYLRDLAEANLYFAKKREYEKGKTAEK